VTPAAENALAHATREQLLAILTTQGAPSPHSAINDALRGAIRNYVRLGSLSERAVLDLLVTQRDDHTAQDR